MANRRSRTIVCDETWVQGLPANQSVSPHICAMSTSSDLSAGLDGVYPFPAESFWTGVHIYRGVEFMRLALHRSLILMLGLVGQFVVGCDSGSEGTRAATDASPANSGNDAAPDIECDTTAFCLEVFAPADVDPIIEQQGLIRGQSATTGVCGWSHCDVWTAGGTTIGDFVATVGIECRPGAGPTGVPLIRQIMSSPSYASADGSYEDIELGRGGGYAHTPGGILPRHSVGFVHETVPCRALLQVKIIDGVTKANTMALAEHVSQRLTMDNYPR